MEQFEKFAADNAITVRATRISSRPDWEVSDKYPAPVHFLVVLSMGDVTLWTGEYSQGIGYAESWAKKNTSKFIGYSVGAPGHGFPMTDALRNGPGNGKTWRAESNYWENLREVYARAVERQGQNYRRDNTRVERTRPVLLTPDEILLSLQLDTNNSDQDFEDWAADYGYSSDSIQKRGIWEACNKDRRALQRGLGDKFAEFMELEE